MEPERICPECEAQVPANAPQGLCPRCLVAIGLKLTPSRDPGAEGSPLIEDPKSKIQNPKVRFFGDYELLEEIARGGMGVVYRARQASLNRIVAVKMLLFGRFSSDEFVQRFQTEAQAVASLQHPNIVAIHEVGQHEGQHYFSMDYIEGKSLAELVGDKPLPARRAAGYIQSIAQAIHYAHKRGILHRDLKPSNVLIDEFDQPRITDFGLAKQLKGDSELTATGQVLGSPNFMPPEQADAKRGAIGRHSDVYSLGAIFYHLLTGRPPFLAETLEDTLRQLLNVEPVPPRLLNPGVPRDLETICLKCLSKEPHRRYDSAQSLAQDLERWQAGKPIFARAVGPTEKFLGWCKRKPAIAVLTALVLTLLVTVTVGSTIAAFRIRRESERAKKAELEAREQLWGSYLAQARATRHTGRAGHRFESLEVLARAAAMRPTLELRNEAIAALALTDIRVLKQSKPLNRRKEFVCLDHKLDRYAEADEAGNIRICQVSDDKELMRLPGFGSAPWWIFPFSPNGQFLAVRYTDGRARIWDWQRKQSILEVPGADSPARLDFSPDSRWLAATDAALKVMVYDLIERKPVRLTEPSTEQWAVRFDPTGKLLAASRGEAITIIEALSGSEVGAKMSHAGSEVRGLAWHPDGKHLVSVCADRLVCLWDIPSRQLIRSSKGHDREAMSVVFNHAGNLLATCGWDSKLRLWDFKSGRELISIVGGGFDLQFTHDDHRLSSHSWDGNRFELFEVVSGTLRSFHEELAGSERGLGPSAFSADGKLLAYCAGDQLKLWDVGSGKLLASSSMAPLNTVLFDASGQNLFVTSQRLVERWPLDSNSSPGEIRLGPPVTLATGGEFGRAALSPQGKILAVIQSNRCRIFHTDSSQEPMSTAIQQDLHWVAVDPAGRWIATAAWGHEGAKVWEASSGRLCSDLPAGRYSDILFSPDGRWLVTRGEQEYRFWNVGEWTPGPHLAHTRDDEMHSDASLIALSPDGRTLALTDAQTVRLVDSKTGREFATLEADNAREISSLSFSGDGRWLAVAGGSDRLHVWDLRTLRENLGRIRLDWEAPPLPPSAEGQIRITNALFTAKSRKTVLQSGAEPVAKPARP
jgi:WD40 repeat protein/predicted Ser/Thr protein kinase